MRPVVNVIEVSLLSAGQDSAGGWQRPSDNDAPDSEVLLRDARAVRGV